MGKWDHRPSRRFLRRRRSPVRPPKFYDINAPLPEYWQDGIPLWEKKYCTIVGLVPWTKIVDSKMFVYYHSNVFDWNDSAAKEAFQNAKKRYWAMVNSLPCDVPLPDPDSYIDQIDWNPYIDPNLIKEADRALFTVPDEEQENSMKNKRTKTSVNDESPWEYTDIPLSRALENNKVQGWNQRNSGDVDYTENPWECSITRENRGLTNSNNAWEGGLVKSWGWNEGKDHNNRCKDWNSRNLEDKGWGKVGDRSWCQQQSNNLTNIGHSSWQCESSQQNVSGWKQQEKTDVSRRNYGGWTSRNKGNQWSRGSHRHTLGSQFHKDGRQTGQYWEKKIKKRDFVP